MKKALLFISGVALSVHSVAQEARSNWQLGLFGGLSVPLGEYKTDIGMAKNGLNAGLNLDYFFKGSSFGLGIDARYQRHATQAFVTDSFSPNSLVYNFSNGYTSFDHSGNNSFSHIGLSLGPVYRIQSTFIDFNFYARAGALFQQYPEYRQTIHALNPFTGQYEAVLSPFGTDNKENKPVALMGILGLKMLYNITPRIGVGIQADYLRTFGNSGTFSVAYNQQMREIKSIEFRDEQKEGDYTNNVYEHFAREKTRRSAAIQDFNLGIAVQFKLGSADGGNAGIRKGGVATTVAVKDKKTGLALSGVTVSIVDQKGKTYTAVTDANGTVNTQLKPGTYKVSGNKNNLNTNTDAISLADFKNDNVYKEIYHDDERFTLSGETVDCETQSGLGGITTQLTRAQDGKVIEQVSDRNGKFYYQLDKNTDYQVVAIENGKFSQTELVTTKGLNRNNTLYVALQLGVCEIAEGKEFVVKNILYDFNQSFIRSDAASVLNNLAQTLKRNPKMTIELSSHTDSRGDNNYNMKLSQERAEAAVNFLVSKGISRSRLTAKGFGESRLKNKCRDGVQCTETDHEQNRRTEIKILKY
ncbi:MAG: OmpA family protein [Sphingobacteriales bacterium]|nr:MAG: OmpA family protein [Sphingobacteriales bacterium]